VLLLFATEFGIDRGQVRKAVRTFAESAFRDTENRAEERLRESTDLPASRFFHKVVAVPHGLQTLIGMRDDIRKAVRADDLAGVTGGKALAEKSFGQVGDLSKKIASHTFVLELIAVVWDVWVNAGLVSCAAASDEPEGQETAY